MWVVQSRQSAYPTTDNSGPFPRVFQFDNEGQRISIIDNILLVKHPSHVETMVKHYSTEAGDKM